MPELYMSVQINLYYQKVVIYHFSSLEYSHTLHPPLFSLANLVQPTRLSSTALLLAGYFLSSLPPIKDWGIPMK